MPVHQVYFHANFSPSFHEYWFGQFSFPMTSCESGLKNSNNSVFVPSLKELIKEYLNVVVQGDNGVIITGEMGSNS